MFRWIALVLLALLIGLQLKLWSARGGMHEVDALHAAIKKQTDENTRLQRRNQSLAADVEDLKHGDKAIEARARTDLGLIKPGEVFYQVDNQPAGASTTLPLPPPARPVGPVTGPIVQ